VIESRRKCAGDSEFQRCHKYWPWCGRPWGSQWVVSGKPNTFSIKPTAGYPLATHWLTVSGASRCPNHSGRLCSTRTLPSRSGPEGLALFAARHGAHRRPIPHPVTTQEFLAGRPDWDGRGHEGPFALLLVPRVVTLWFQSHRSIVSTGGLVLTSSCEANWLCSALLCTRLYGLTEGDWNCPGRATSKRNGA
jgi:hypothetical protein